MKTKNIYVIRHGETDWNKTLRFQGQTDIHLNDLGQEQAKALVPILNRLQIESIYSSPLARAFKTAEIANVELKLSIHKDDRLKETNIGVAEGKSAEEVIALLGEDAVAKWRSYEERLLDFRFEKGESKRQVMCRARTVLLDIAQNSNRKNIAVFSHGMLMRGLTFVFGSGVAWEQHAFSNGCIHHFLWSDDQPEFLVYKGKLT